ncbi:hypothetical protein [Pseudothermotoga elfii]
MQWKIDVHVRLINLITKILRSRLEKVRILKDANHVSTIGWHIVNRLKQRL